VIRRSRSAERFCATTAFAELQRRTFRRSISSTPRWRHFTGLIALVEGGHSSVGDPEEGVILLPARTYAHARPGERKVDPRSETPTVSGGCRDSGRPRASGRRESDCAARRRSAPAILIHRIAKRSTNQCRLAPRLLLCATSNDFESEVDASVGVLAEALQARSCS
jgi:hypothetical protein